MRLGAIDIGTNSCRMLVVDYNESNYREVKRSLKITRLGEGVDENKKLSGKAVNRSLEAITAFIREMKELKVDRVGIVGTSALRDVSNSQVLINRVKKNTGYELRVISGREEACLVYKGASSSINDNDFIIIDIGGGSTEFIWEDEKLNLISLDMGSVRMTERFMGNFGELISDNNIKRIETEVTRMIKENNISLLNKRSAIGVGGTITTLAAIDLKMTNYNSDLIHGYQLTSLRVIEILDMLKDKGLEDRKNITGLEPDRADIIIAGTVILKVIMELLALTSITVSERGILYGVIDGLL